MSLSKAKVVLYKPSVLALLVLIWHPLYEHDARVIHNANKSPLKWHEAYEYIRRGEGCFFSFLYRYEIRHSDRNDEIKINLFLCYGHTRLLKKKNKTIKMDCGQILFSCK